MNLKTTAAVAATVSVTEKQKETVADTVAADTVMAEVPVKEVGKNGCQMMSRV